MLLDRGMEVDHTSIFRWIQTYVAPGCCQRQHGVGHRRQPDCSTKPDALTIHLSVQNVASITRMLARVVLWFDFHQKSRRAIHPSRQLSHLTSTEVAMDPD